MNKEAEKKAVRIDGKKLEQILGGNFHAAGDLFSSGERCPYCHSSNTVQITVFYAYYCNDCGECRGGESNAVTCD